MAKTSFREVFPGYPSPKKGGVEWVRCAQIARCVRKADLMHGCVMSGLRLRFI